MLENFEQLGADMQAYFLRICRPCNQCMGCTKGGRNKPFTIIAADGNGARTLCPQFPRHEWEGLDPHMIRLLMRYHDLQAQASNG